MRLLSSVIFSCFYFIVCGQDAWVQNSEYFRNKLPYQIGTYLFEDGSFQLTEGNYRFKFDSKGILNRELTQEIVEEKSDAAQKTSGCTAYDMKQNIRYTLEDNLIHVEKMFSGKKNEYRAIHLEKQEHVVKSVWDKYSNNSNHVDAGIITSLEGRIILYQTYYAISANTHPDLFKPKGINTYLRLSIVDLKDYSVSYEYLLIDVFNPLLGKKKEVLDRLDFKCIGMNSRQELLFSISKTIFKDRDAPPLSLSDYKGIDYCNSSIDIWSVNLRDFSQKKVYSTSIESTPKAASVSLSFIPDGWMLTWTEKIRKGEYSFHAKVFSIDEDYDVREIRLNFPPQDLKLPNKQTPNLRVYSDQNGRRLYCLTAGDYPSVFVMNADYQLITRDNSVLKWDLLKNYVLSDSEILCLPCMKELSPEDVANLSGLPEEINAEEPNTRILRFRKVGEKVYYVHIETSNKVVETGHTEKITELFLKTGSIGL